MRLYHSKGHSYLVCPRLLELDTRHGQHPEKWPACRRPVWDEKSQALVSEHCHKKHKHELPLLDPEGHRVDNFIWVPGCRPPTEDEHPVCGCGRRLVYSDLDDLYHPRHLAENEF